MLKHVIPEQAQKKQQQIKQEEILKEICQQIPNVKEKIKELSKLLLLMQAIKKLSEKEGKTPEEINSLNEMFAMYEEQEIALAGHESSSQTSLNVNTVINSTVEPVITINSDNPPKQIGDGNSLFEQIQKTQLKKVKKNEVQMSKADHDVDGFVISKAVLEKIKLNSVKPKNSVASILEDKPTELELKLAKQKALVEQKDTLKPDNSVNAENTSGEIPKLLSVPNFERILTDKDLINYKLAKLRRLKSSILSDEEFDDLEFKIIEDLSSRISMIPEVNESTTNSMIFTDEEPSNPNSTMNELDELLEALYEQVSALDNETKKPQAPLSMHFHSHDKDKPIIVEETPKLKSKV